MVKLKGLDQTNRKIYLVAVLSLSIHPVTGPARGVVLSSRPFLSPNPCLFPRVPIHGADIDGLSERKQGGWRAAAGCAAMTCVGVGERGTHGKEGGGRIRGEKGGLGDDGRRHPSKGCRPALGCRCFCFSAAGVPLAGLHACCIGFCAVMCPAGPRARSALVPRPERAQLKSISMAFYTSISAARGCQAAASCCMHQLAPARPRPYLIVHTPLAQLSCTYPIRSTTC